MESLSSENEPTQLTIENFLEFLNGHSQEQPNANEQQNEEGDSQGINQQEGGNNLEDHHVDISEGSLKRGGKVSQERWTVLDTRVLMDRKETSFAAQKLDLKPKNSNKAQFQPFIQDYEENPPSLELQKQYLIQLVTAQRNDIIDFNSKYPFSIVLCKRLDILEAIYVSLSKKFQCTKLMKYERSKEKKGKLTNNGRAPTALAQGSDVMIELGVKTGLSLLFSLMKQSWVQNTDTSGICSDVLETALSVISSLRPLSLANDAKLPKLASESLEQVMRFLREVMNDRISIAASDKQMCTEILFGLALQRGSLLALLDWIETGFKSCLNSHEICLERGTFAFWLRQMHNNGVSFSD